MAINRVRSYKNDLLETLTDPIEAKEYVNAALEDENPEVFLLALRDVLEANSKISKLAWSDDYPIQLKKGNYELDRVHNILNQIGLKLTVEVNQNLSTES